MSQLQTFNPSDQSPETIAPQHWYEWLDSGVSPEIIAANVISLDGDRPYGYLLYSNKLERRNDGRVPNWVLRRYQHVEQGGWWCAGVDLLALKEDSSRSSEDSRSLWGQFKPDLPYIDADGKTIKYEAPPKTETRVIALLDPKEPNLWSKVLEDPSIPIVIGEGAKKAGCVLSLGYAAIALPGIFNGYRKETQRLIEDLAVVCAPGRPICICFDHDQKEKTKQNVNLATARLGRLLSLAGCSVRVIELPGPEKGVDDFVVVHGKAAFDALLTSAPLLEQWEVRNYSHLTYPAGFTLNHRFLGSIDLPEESRLIGIKAPKGTGKTETMIAWVQEAIQQGQPVLVLTHRVQLGQALCNRFGINYVNEIRESETGTLLGFGLCMDSLHPTSQAHFRAAYWRDPLVIIDEAEQVIWHTLSSTTEVRQHRIVILKELQQLLRNALNPAGSGRVVLSDADLTDLSLDFVKGLAGVPELKPWIILNTWKPPVGWNIYHYDQTTPTAWVAALEEHVASGGKPLILLTGQSKKSTWGTQNIEARLSQQFPSKRVLRIDSQSIADPSHPAYGCITRLNEILSHYDIVIASPSIETGVSIDLKGHFTSVWGCFTGNTPTNSVTQSLARLRDSVDRHIWVIRRGLGQIGNGSTKVGSLIKSQTKVVRSVLKVLRELDFEDLDVAIDPIAERTWAKMACRINAQIPHYRESVVAALRLEGHTVLEQRLTRSPDDLKQLYGEMKTSAQTNYRSECEAIAAAEDMNKTEAEIVGSKRAKTEADRFKERKYQLKQRYRVEVSPELVEKDDKGWYPQIRLHYYLSLGRNHLKQRDLKVLESALQSGEGAIWNPDLKASLLTHQILVLEKLGLLSLLTPGIELRNSDPRLRQMAERVKADPWQTKALLGLTINPQSSPVVVVRQLLSKLGLRLELLRKEGPRGQQERVYTVTDLNDGRSPIFTAWLERDRSLVVSDPIDLEIKPVLTRGVA